MASSAADHTRAPIGPRLRARGPAHRQGGIALGAELLKRMIRVAKPASVRIAGCRWKADAGSCLQSSAQQRRSEEAKERKDGTRLALSTVEARSLPTGAATMDHIAPAQEPSSIPRHPNSRSDGSRHLGLSTEELLNAVRCAMERNPEAARAAALRLVNLLTPPAAAESASVRGGLATTAGHKRYHGTEEVPR